MAILILILLHEFKMSFAVKILATSETIQRNDGALSRSFHKFDMLLSQDWKTQNGTYSGNFIGVLNLSCQEAHVVVYSKNYCAVHCNTLLY